ncbi:MAG: hypothetical protein AB3N63_03480 [Puniceicoccaceae bacterium]
MSAKRVLFLCIILIVHVLTANEEVLNTVIYHDPDRTDLLLQMIYQEDEVIYVIFESTGPFWEYEFWSRTDYVIRKNFSMATPFPLLLTHVSVADYPGAWSFLVLQDRFSPGTTTVHYMSSRMAARIESRLGYIVESDPPIQVNESAIEVPWRIQYDHTAFDGWVEHWVFGWIYTNSYPWIYKLSTKDWIYVTPDYLFETIVDRPSPNREYEYDKGTLGFWLYSSQTQDWHYSSFESAPYAWSFRDKTWQDFWN